MGWLRDLMVAAAPPFRSFDSLAEAALKHPGWPIDDRLKSRSLAAILSKLDRRLELDWLIQRPRAQHVFAELLGARLVDVDARTEQQRRLADQAAGRLRWLDLPDARPLDLGSEALCPGLPLEVKIPSLWSARPLWWQAPDGAGRSLVGRWLSARGLALHVDAPSFDAARERLPASGFVFLELHRPAADVVIPDGVALCVAAPFPPAAPTFTPIRSPELPSFVDELAAWVGARVPADGQFEPGAAATWLRERAAEGSCRTLGDALALSGLLDRVGQRALARPTPVKLARLLLKSRVEAELGRGVHDVAWLSDAGFPLLCALARRTLTDDPTALLEARSFEAWLELVPLEYRRGGDLDWLRLSLSAPGSSVRPSDVDKVARQLPPGAFKALRGLAAIDVLRETTEPQRLAIRPHWLAHAALGEARRRLLDASPLEWGEALLEPQRSPELMTELAARVLRDPAPFVEAVLELETADELAAVAALEAVLRGVGLALLEGAEVAPDQLAQLWQEQSRQLVSGGVLPLPRLAYPDACVRACPALGTPAFYVAALAISEQLDRRSSQGGVLRPWDETTPPAALRALYTRIAELFAAPEPAAFAWHVPALVDRLRSVLGSVGLDGAAAHALELPGIALDEIEHGVASWTTLEALAESPHAFRALQALAQRRRVELGRIAEACWTAWQTQEPGAELGLLLPLSDAQRELWRALPAPLTARAVEALAGTGAALPAERLTPEHWTEWLARYRSVPGLRAEDGRAPLAAAPPAVLERALAGAETDGALVADAWSQAPAVVARRLLALCRSEPERAVRCLLRSRPGALRHTADLLAALTDVGWPAPLQHELRFWLHDAVRRREPGFREAYALLARIEHDLSPH